MGWVSAARVPVIAYFVKEALLRGGPQTEAEQGEQARVVPLVTVE